MIELRALSKNYGRFTAVDQLTLEVPKGELFGFLGPNGAGKTTTLRMIAGILQPTAGTVVIGGEDIQQNPEAAKAKLVAGIASEDLKVAQDAANSAQATIASAK